MTTLKHQEEYALRRIEERHFKYCTERQWKLVEESEHSISFVIFVHSVTILAEEASADRFTLNVSAIQQN